MTDSVAVLRGDRIESRHAVHVAVVDEASQLVASVGDPQTFTFLRSAAKPFQALPLVEDGIVEDLSLTQEELALCCASHSGEPIHTRLVSSILAKIGLTEDSLECGPHLPFSESEAKRILRNGGEAAPIHNNCSGKHAGMLALAVHHGWDRGGYVDKEHPVQRRMLREMARWTGVAEESIGLGIDGCAVVCFAVSLKRMAGAFARFGAAALRNESPAAIVSAMTAHPALVAGSGRLDTALMERAGERVLTKTGAEGVHGAALSERGLGIALKVEDGGRRAADVALIRVLEELEVLDARDFTDLAAFRRPAVKNTRGDRVGQIRPEFHLSFSDRGRRKA